MKNGLSDLNDLLFEQLDRLTDDTGDVDIEKEIRKTRAILGVADQITNIAGLQIDAMKTMANLGLKPEEMPALITPKDAKAYKKPALIGGL